MPGETEPAELRALRQKAYGRDGVLTDAESQRLRELEHAHRSSPASGRVVAEPDESVMVQPAGPDPSVVLAENQPPVPVATPEPSESDAPALPATLRGSLRRHAAALFAATAILLAIGVGAGWALFAPRDASIPLTDEQQQRRAELAAALFDPASIRAIAQKDEALVWYATQGGGEKLCLILDVGTQSQTDCISSNQAGVGLSASLPAPPEAAGEQGSVNSEAVAASLVFSTTGEPLVAIRRWSMTSSFLGSFEDAERDRAEALIEEGYELGLSLVGSFRGAPVWLADRVGGQGATERCMIVDATDAVSCAPFESALQSGLGAQIVDADPAGAATVISVIHVLFTTQQTPYLTITEAPVTGVAPGDFVVVDAPPGDPIRVEPPGRGTGG